MTRRHGRSRSSLEVQHADDPAPALVPAHWMIAIIVQAAAVAHQRAAGRRRNQFAKRVNAILARQRSTPTSGLRFSPTRIYSHPPAKCSPSSRIALLAYAQNAALAQGEELRSNAGARDRARSGDLVFFRHALYQLSYPGPKLKVKGKRGKVKDQFELAFYLLPFAFSALVGDDGLEPPTTSV